MKKETLHGAVVELYNLQVPGRSPFWYTNGFYVARYVNGTRHETLRDFKADEAGARAYAASLQAAGARFRAFEKAAPRL